MKKLILITLLSLLVLSCNMNQGGSLTTEIEGITWLYINQPIINDSSDDSTLLEFTGFLTNDILAEDITSIIIEHEYSGYIWEVSSQYIPEIYYDDYGVFQILFDYPSVKDLITIGDYTVKVVLKNGYTTVYTLNVPAPGERDNSDFNFAGNEDYTGNISHASLPQRAQDLTIDKNTESVVVEFTVSQELIFSGYVVFYDNTGTFIGGSTYAIRDYENSEINSFVNDGNSFFTDGTKNTLTLIGDDLYLENGYGTGDIYEVVVILTDGFQYEGTSNTYDAMSFSYTIVGE